LSTKGFNDGFTTNQIETNYVGEIRSVVLYNTTNKKCNIEELIINHLVKEDSKEYKPRTVRLQLNYTALIDKILLKSNEIKIENKEDNDENDNKEKINAKKELDLKDEVLDILAPKSSFMTPDISNINLLKANT